jgi:hypothetical protein
MFERKLWCKDRQKEYNIYKMKFDIEYYKNKAYAFIKKNGTLARKIFLLEEENKKLKEMLKNNLGTLKEK